MRSLTASEFGALLRIFYARNLCCAFAACLVRMSVDLAKTVEGVLVKKKVNRQQELLHHETKASQHAPKGVKTLLRACEAVCSGRGHGDHRVRALSTRSSYDRKGSPVSRDQNCPTKKNLPTRFAIDVAEGFPRGSPLEDLPSNT